MSDSLPAVPERFVVLAAVDDSGAAERIIRAGANFARLIKGGELHLVRVIEQLPPLSAPPLTRASVAPSATQALEQARAAMDALVTRAKLAGAGRVTTHIALGGAWHEIVQLATDLAADLVLVGTHDRHGVRRLMLGSVAERVVRKAPCPVLVVREKDHAKVDPEIEPACPDCLDVQRESGGEVLWCERHATKHPRGRLHNETPAGFGEGSQLYWPMF
jgi:nucleotide-binding universal stress UspA family protein